MAKRVVTQGPLSELITHIPKKLFLPLPQKPLLMLEAAPKTRYFVKNANPAEFHPGHVRMAKMDRRSGVESVEGGFIHGDTKAAAWSFSFFKYPVKTETVTKRIPPGLETDLVWQPQPGERVFERDDERHEELPPVEKREEKKVMHERYDCLTDCVSEALRAAKVPLDDVTTLPYRVWDSTRAVKKHGFKEIVPPQ